MKLMKKFCLILLSTSIAIPSALFAQSTESKDFKHSYTNIYTQELQSIIQTDQAEISEYLNNNARSLPINEEITYTVNTSSGNTYDVILKMEEKNTNDAQTYGQDKYEVKANTDYIFTYKQKELNGRTGEFTAKVDYTVGDIKGGIVAGLTANSTSLENIAPPQGMKLEGDDIWIDDNDGYTIYVKGYITFLHTVSNLTVNCYPTISIVPAGNSSTSANKVLITYGYTM